MTASLRLASSLAVVLGLAIAPAVAQDATAFELDLNAATETEGGGCRLTYVATNLSDLAFERTAFQVGLFDAEGTVTRLLVLEFGELIAGKTKILQFELAGSSCATISRIVVNDVAACTLADGTTSDFCLSRLVATSRTAIQFGI
ncbi:hypothetical protein [Tabrizicola aquatica]|uniref:hypothetical protein n=1 Tax=Tabrizicola aquatica TaxID=909926 RepID=UPI001FEBC8F9|nr:hypothetical protein [Tabrizicola aquatica]